MTVVETERLLLQQAHHNDRPFFFKLLNSPDWIAYIGDRGVHSLEDAGDYIQNALIQSYTDNGFGLYKIVLKANDQPIGICGLLKRSKLANPDIGFALLPEYQGNGYAFEAAQATLMYARSKLGLDTIFAITKANNTKSKRLLEKIGLKQIDPIMLGKEELLCYSNEKI